jgi:hypothetical protein
MSRIQSFVGKEREWYASLFYRVCRTLHDRVRPQSFLRALPNYRFLKRTRVPTKFLVRGVGLDHHEMVKVSSMRIRPIALCADRR